MFWFDTEKALFQVILDELELLRYVLRCVIEQQL